MSYAFKVLKIADFPEWTNPNQAELGAGPNVPGSELKRRATVEVSNGQVVLETRDFLIAEPYTTEKLQAEIDAYKSTLPNRHPDEGLVL